MKKLLVLTAMVLFSTTIIKAQTADPELDYIKKAYSREKKAIVEEYMQLDVQEGAKFWPVYAAYESGREKLAQERIKLIEEYANSGGNITSELADKLANGVLANNLALDKLNMEYYKKMKKATDAQKAAKFMQLETYLQTAWRSVIQENIPLIEELDKTQQK